MTWATILCFLLLPLLFTLLGLWLERRGRFPPEVWEAYQKALAQGRWAVICRDRCGMFGWYVLDQETGTVVFSLDPIDRRWVSGSWLVTDRMTGETLSHGTWQRAWGRHPCSRQQASPHPFCALLSKLLTLHGVPG